MNTLLCSRNDSVLRRWHEALKDSFQIYEATTIEQANRILASKDITIFFLHRAMVDQEKLSELVANAAKAKVFILADRPSNQEGITCLKMGCHGYSNTYIAGPRLNLAAQTVLSGLVWTGTTLLQYLLDQAPANRETTGETANEQVLGQLSKREYQVASLVSRGLPNKDIAEELGISERTVKAHLSSIYSKTRTHNRVGLSRIFGSN